MMLPKVKTEIGMSERLHRKNRESFEKTMRGGGGVGVGVGWGWGWGGSCDRRQAELQNVELHTLRMRWARNIAHIAHTTIVYGVHVRKHEETTRKT